MFVLPLHYVEHGMIQQFFIISLKVLKYGKIVFSKHFYIYKKAHFLEKGFLSQTHGLKDSLSGVYKTLKKKF